MLNNVRKRLFEFKTSSIFFAYLCFFYVVCLIAIHLIFFMFVNVRFHLFQKKSKFFDWLKCSRTSIV